MAKFRLGSMTLESVDTYVRVTVENIGGIGAPPMIKCTDMECPTQIQVCELICNLRGFRAITQLDRATRQAAGRVADDAKNSRLEWAL
jgi:hypothetical protein